MADLVDLYRARRGATNEQRENFLSAALGLLLDGSTDGRDRLAPLLSIPVSGPMRVVCQEPLFSAKGDPVGRPDLRLDVRSAGTIRSVVVEVKFDVAARVEQLERYADATERGQVVLLSVPDSDRRIADAARCRHVTWQQVADALHPSTDPLCVRFAWLLATFGVSSHRVLTYGALRAPLAPVHQAFNEATRAVIPLLVPSGHRASVSRLLRDGHPEEDAGFSFDVDAAVARREGLSLSSLGLSVDLEALDGVSLWIWAAPTAKRLRGLLIAAGGWDESGDSLVASLGTYWSERPLSECLAEAASRARHLLVVPPRFTPSNGLWTRAPGLVPAPALEGSVGELRQALSQKSAVALAAEALSARWLRSLREALGGERCGAITSWYDGSFYQERTAPRRLQVGVCMYPGQGDESLYSWAWFQDTDRARRFEHQCRLLGWKTLPGRTDHTVVACPVPASDQPLDAGFLLGVAEQFRSAT